MEVAAVDLGGSVTSFVSYSAEWTFAMAAAQTRCGRKQMMGNLAGSRQQSGSDLSASAPSPAPSASVRASRPGGPVLSAPLSSFFSLPQSLEE